MSQVTVIGAGLAGLSATRVLADAGMQVRLVSPQASERAQSVLAEGGINAVLDIMGENDTLAEHFADTMKGGVWLADPNAVWGLVNEAPQIIADLIGCGVPFQVENGRMIQRNFGGQKKKRTAYAKSSTGKVLVTALIDAVRKLEGAGLVERMPRHEFVSLEIEAGTCRGVWVRDVYAGDVSYLSGPVVLAYGGMGGLFGDLTTGTTQSTGDVAAMLFAQGMEMGNLEMLQYHPTTVSITGKRMLITEAARGEGGRLFALRDGKPWYFMEERYPELGNLMPRDVVSREEHYVMQDPACTGQVWLDMRHLSRDIWKNRLSDLRDEVIHYLDIDPAKDPIPVTPGIHYCMGGALVDEGHRTNIGFAYAAGECSCQYHGANRLGGNSLLGAIRGGRCAARTLLADLAAAGEDAVCAEPARTADDVAAIPGANGVIAGDNAAEAARRDALMAAMGIVRDRAGLEEGLARLAAIDRTHASQRLVNRIVLSQAIVSSALAREESRGAHTRSDFPERRPEFRKTTVARFADGAPVIEMRDIPELREGPAEFAIEPAAGGAK